MRITATKKHAKKRRRGKGQNGKKNVNSKYSFNGYQYFRVIKRIKIVIREEKRIKTVE
jgi:hypothetical protein